MKLLILNGARNPEGQTARAAEALAEGARSGGADVEHVLLPTLAIERCRQCDENGWGTCRTAGACVIEDDLPPLVEKMAEADAVAFATPVYFSDLSESLRALLDRLRRTCMHDAGRARVDGTPAVGICVAGGGGGGAPECARNLEHIVARCGFECLDIIPVRRQNLDPKLPVLQATGRWLAEA